MKEIKALITKDIQLEWRQRYALNGMLLYVVSTVFICFLSFRIKGNDIDPITWNTLFWIILLFTSVNAIAKSFTQERAGRQLYYYMIASSEGIIISKMLYNSVLMTGLSLLAFGFYAFVMGNPVGDQSLYLLSVVLGSLGFAGTLTMVAAIASKAENPSMLMSVLSFPLIIPMLLMVMKMAKNALDGLDRASSSDEILTLVSLNAIVWVVSVILFPYLWKS